VANACATLSEFLAQAPEFKTVGPVSSGIATLVANLVAGDTFTVADTLGAPVVSQSYIADTDFAVGVDATATAGNLATAINSNPLSLITAIAVGALVYLDSKATGACTLYALASNTANLTLSGATLTGGDAIVAFALSCACSQINLGCWGVKADCGHVYLTGHFLALQTGIGEGGVLNRKKIDKIEAGFAVATPSDGDLGSTKWGRMYLQIRKTLFIAPLPGRRILPIVC
jgi:hypothetical protein